MHGMQRAWARLARLAQPFISSILFILFLRSLILSVRPLARTDGTNGRALVTPRPSVISGRAPTHTPTPLAAYPCPVAPAISFGRRHPTGEVLA
jgi:hypothetical protein